MNRAVGAVVAVFLALGASSQTYAAEQREVPFTLADRDRLVRIETALLEFKDSVDKRFEQVDKRFEQMDKRFEQVDKRFEQIDKRFDEVNARIEQMMNFIWILASVFGGLVAVTIGFAIWDRRTAMDPPLRKIREVEEREERMERALRLLAERDPKIRETFREAGLL
ncbi:hypothetical protein [Deferrisoma sp.]